jgi:tetratricopeptide (TPR) repeat protein
VNTLFAQARQHHQVGHFQQAKTLYLQLLQIHPNHLHALQGLGQVAQQLGQLDLAIHAFTQAASLNPNHPGIQANLAHALAQTDRLQEAMTHYQHAIALKPDHAKAHVNLGLVLEKLGQPEEALRSYQRAIQMQPDLAIAHNNLGALLKEQGQLAEALTAFERALQLDPQYWSAHYSLVLTLIFAGEWPRAWREYAYYQKKLGQTKFPQPYWDGSSLAGKRVLIWGEQGIGDQLLLASLIPEVLDQADHCLIECEPRLIPLFQRSFVSADYVIRTVPPHPRTQQSDLHLQTGMGTLAQWLRPSWDSFPKHHGYLQVDPNLMQSCRQRYRSWGKGLIVGISWHSTNARKKLAALTEWQPVLSLPDVVWISLQYGDHQQELQTLQTEMGVTIHQDKQINPLISLEDFAAQVAAVDLILSISNTTVHVAGALGKPVWMVLPKIPDIVWWMLDREDSPWYPSMRIFRQSQQGNWQSVFQQVADALSAWIG